VNGHKTNPVPNSYESGMLLIRDGAILPASLAIESEAFLPGWRKVKNFDGYTLSRKIKEVNWSFHRLTGEHSARVMGLAHAVTLQRGISRILHELQGRRFNSLEITVVVLKRILGLAFLSVSASRRHIQGELKVSA